MCRMRATTSTSGWCRSPHCRNVFFTDLLAHLLVVGGPLSPTMAAAVLISLHRPSPPPLQPDPGPVPRPLSTPFESRRCRRRVARSRAPLPASYIFISLLTPGKEIAGEASAGRGGARVVAAAGLAPDSAASPPWTALGELRPVVLSTARSTLQTAATAHRHRSLVDSV